MIQGYLKTNGISGFLTNKCILSWKVQVAFLNKFPFSRMPYLRSQMILQSYSKQNSIILA